MKNRESIKAWGIVDKINYLINASIHHTKEGCKNWAEREFGLSWKRITMQGYRLVEVEVRVMG